MTLATIRHDSPLGPKPSQNGRLARLFAFQSRQGSVVVVEIVIEHKCLDAVLSWRIPGSGFRDEAGVGEGALIHRIYRVLGFHDTI